MDEQLEKEFDLLKSAPSNRINDPENTKEIIRTPEELGRLFVQHEEVVAFDLIHNALNTIVQLMGTTTDRFFLQKITSAYIELQTLTKEIDHNGNFRKTE